MEQEIKKMIFISQSDVVQNDFLLRNSLPPRTVCRQKF